MPDTKDKPAQAAPKSETKAAPKAETKSETKSKSADKPSQETLDARKAKAKARKDAPDARFIEASPDKDANEKLVKKAEKLDTGVSGFEVEAVDGARAVLRLGKEERLVDQADLQRVAKAVAKGVQNTY